jgi:hypothetical protein
MCASNAHNSPAVTNSRALPIRRLRMAPSPSVYPLRWAAVLFSILSVQPQFVNVFAVRDSDRQVCSLIGARRLFAAVRM